MRAALVLAVAAAAPLAAQNAADAYYDPHDMEHARAHMREHMGGQTLSFFQAEQFELLRDADSDRFNWEAQGWVGGDYNRLWLKTEGEAGGGDRTGEIQALWSRPLSRYWDFQAGARQDLAPGASRTFGVVGIQGLAPYWFEIDAAMFVSRQGDVSARLEAEYEMRFTQRLILQPRAEVDLALQRAARFGVGRGISGIESGLRLRYEFRREIAPYVGVSWERVLGGTADLQRASGEGVGGAAFAAGLRFWF